MVRSHVRGQELDMIWDRFIQAIKKRKTTENTNMSRLDYIDDDDEDRVQLEIDEQPNRGSEEEGGGATRLTP